MKTTIKNLWNSPWFRFLGASTIAFLIGTIWHFAPFWGALQNTVYDLWDGLFNLWILRHHSECLQSQNLNCLFETNIYWPENNQAIFFSDILLFPAIIFSALQAVQKNILVAYHLTGFILTFLGWIFYSLIFWKIRGAISKNSGIPTATLDFLSVFFLYLSFFSVSRTYHYIHFQNLSSFWVIFSFLGVWRLFTRRKFAFSIMAFSFLILIATVPYFAILAAIISIVSCCLFIASGGMTYIVKFMKLDVALALAIALTGFPVITRYRFAMADEAHNYFHASGISRQDFFNLFPLTPLHDFFEKYFSIHHGNHEAPAYLGFSLILFVCLFSVVLRSIKRSMSADTFFGNYQSFAFAVFRFVVASILIYIATLVSDHRIYKIFLCALIWFEYFRFGFKTAMQIKLSPAEFYVPLIVFLTITIYAVAFGAMYEDKNALFDPSIAGLFALFIPGFNKLRGIGRFVHFGYLFLNCLLLIWITRTWKDFNHRISRPVLAAFLVLGILQVLETKTGIQKFQIDAGSLYSTQEEHRVLSQLVGTGFSLPANSWEESVYSMNFFVNLPNIKLVNGYSGKITKVFDDFLKESKNQIPFSRLLAHKINYVFLNKYRLTGAEIASFKKKINAASWSLIFENNRISVYKLTA